MSDVSILSYGIGNAGSIVNMLRKLRLRAEIVTDVPGVLNARRLIVPGIGAFDACMKALQASGTREAVLEFAAGVRPLLGICVGMQMLTEGSEEGDMPGLGLVKAEARRFPAASGLRIPHMGWDVVEWQEPGHPLARGLTVGCRFYFVHSYYVRCRSGENSLGSCTYGERFSAAIHAGSIAGVQFHPEKSHRFGLQLLANFAAI